MWELPIWMCVSMCVSVRACWRANILWASELVCVWIIYEVKVLPWDATQRNSNI